MNKEETITKLKIRSSRLFPFFSTFIFKSNIEFVEGKNYTNGFTIALDKNKDFDDMFWVYCHELFHVAFKHIPRYKSLEKESSFMLLYNILTDWFINDTLLYEVEADFNKGVLYEGINYRTVGEVMKKILSEEGYEKFQELADRIRSGAYLDVDDTFNILKGYVSEEKIKENIANSCGVGDDNQGEDDDMGDGNLIKVKKELRIMEDFLDGGKDEKEKEELEKAIMQGVINSGLIAGKGITRVYELLRKELFKQEVRWERLLKNRIKSMIKAGSTYKKLHRKSYSINKGGLVCIPIRKNKEKFKLVIGVDMSGSVETEHIAKFVREIEGMFKQGKVEATLLYFTDRVFKEVDLKKASDIEKIKREAYGGTNFIPVIKRAKELKAKQLVIFTDGYGSAPEKKPRGMDIVWILNNKENKNSMPYGKAIVLNEVVE